MPLQFLLLIIGLALLIKGGDLFVGAAVRMAELLRLPRVVIGSTLVSLATTLPELVVSIMAGAQGASDLAVGNAVGSCVCNIGLILGLTAALKHIAVHPPALRVPLVAMFLFGLLVMVMTTDLVLSRWQGVLLVVLGSGYFVYDFVRHARDTGPGDIAEAAAIERDLKSRFAWLNTRWGTMTQFLLAAGIVVFGSRVLVDAAVNIAAALGIPSIVIGLTVVAVGTSLPELVTAITSSRRNVSDLAVGNIVGANIANLSLVLGAAAALHEVTLDRATQLLNFPALLASMVLLLYVILTENRVTRRQGALLLASYAVYLAAVLGLAVLRRG